MNELFHAGQLVPCLVSILTTLTYQVYRKHSLDSGSPTKYHQFLRSSHRFVNLHSVVFAVCGCLGTRPNNRHRLLGP